MQLLQTSGAGVGSAAAPAVVHCDSANFAIDADPQKVSRRFRLPVTYTGNGRKGGEVMSHEMLFTESESTYALVVSAMFVCDNLPE
ncbi:hypothetical protein [Mycobacterium angelicum]|uniref:hypothetical protein n=1 Tax=Mycobacterium angelicum TaxID=470074 RepID=UPI001B808F65|nr:hypothetical protein [Mycobacterium angelicum]